MSQTHPNWDQKHTGNSDQVKIYNWNKQIEILVSEAEKKNQDVISLGVIDLEAEPWRKTAIADWRKHGYKMKTSQGQVLLVKSKMTSHILG